MDVKISKEAILPTKFGDFVIQAFSETRVEKADTKTLEHLVLRTQKIAENPLIRVHSECLTGDALGSLKCDCGLELEQALSRIKNDGNGMLIYLRQEGRGIGLFNKVNAYSLQDLGFDTVEANEALGFADDERDYEIVGFILRHFGVERLRMMTNNPKKIEFLQKFAEITRASIFVKSNPHNEKYLAIKRQKLGHLLEN